MKKLISSVCFITYAYSFCVNADFLKINNAEVSIVYVNGGLDAPNSGTTCIKIEPAPSDNCPSGMIGIANNNQPLLSAALTAKSTAAKTWVYYSDSESPPLHCPGKVYTPCALITLGILD